MKTLYLIQLWADTFMMHEDEFPHIMKTYRLLRKEGSKKFLLGKKSINQTEICFLKNKGIEFPPRDLNQKFMIKFKGQESPIFAHLE